MCKKTPEEISAYFCSTKSVGWGAIFELPANCLFKYVSFHKSGGGLKLDKHKQNK